MTKQEEFQQHCDNIEKKEIIKRIKKTNKLREHFAGLAMHAIILSEKYEHMNKDDQLVNTAITAVDYADSLIDRLTQTWKE